MPSGEAKFARIHNGLPHLAEVAVEIDFSTGSAEILCACSGGGFVAQGTIEDVPATGYEDWKAGARAGVGFALSVAALPPARVTIRRISGLSTDTNPTVVGAAAALALWRAVGFTPPAHTVERLSAAALASWQRPLHEVPRFE
jgi:hypothetical protein